MYCFANFSMLSPGDRRHLFPFFPPLFFLFVWCWFFGVFGGFCFCFLIFVLVSCGFLAPLPPEHTKSTSHPTYEGLTAAQRLTPTMPVTFITIFWNAKAITMPPFMVPHIPECNLQPQPFLLPLLPPWYDNPPLRCILPLKGGSSHTAGLFG